MNSICIAFGCQARVGKSTAVNYLISRYGGIEKTFAGPLYDILHYAQEVCGFKKEKDRQFLQYIGTDWARSRNQFVWIDVLLREINKLEETANIYISDVRFPNELSALKELGFKTVKIIRDESTSDHSFGLGNREHESEVAFLDTSDSEWDYIIYNNGSLEEFYRNLDDIIKDISDS